MEEAESKPTEQEITATPVVEELNSDDDETSTTIPTISEPEIDPFVEKTKCAFDFSNSVIFDLD